MDVKVSYRRAEKVGGVRGWEFTLRRSSDDAIVGHGWTSGKRTDAVADAIEKCREKGWTLR